MPAGRDSLPEAHQLPRLAHAVRAHFVEQHAARRDPALFVAADDELRDHAAREARVASQPALVATQYENLPANTNPPSVNHEELATHAYLGQSRSRAHKHLINRLFGGRMKPESHNSRRFGPADI